MSEPLRSFLHKKTIPVHFHELTRGLGYDFLSERITHGLASRLWDSQRLLIRDAEKESQAVSMYAKKKGSNTKYWESLYLEMVKKVGSLDVIFGCMRSGKSDHLVHKCLELKKAGVFFLAFKPEIDNRDGSFIKTRTPHLPSVEAISVKSSRKLLTVFLTHVSEAVAKRNDSAFPSAVFIDEAQFFGPKILDVIQAIKSFDVQVYVSLLDYDYRGQPFPFLGSDTPTSALIKMASKSIHCRAICEVCGAPATRTQRLKSGKESTQNEPVVEIGDLQYETRCLDCFIKV